VVSSGRVLPSADRRPAHFRAHERRFVQIHASLWHPDGTEPMPVKVLNVGLGGAGIACQSVLRQEDRVLLTLLSQTLVDPLVLAARVAWVQGPARPAWLYAGLDFETPDRSVLLTLFHLIGALTY